MNKAFQSLEAAIADAGIWHWWRAEVPKFFQAEFLRVRLYLPPGSASSAPCSHFACSHFALMFGQPHEICFLDLTEEVEADWPLRVNRDELHPGPLADSGFVLNDEARITQLLAQAVRCHDYFKLADSPKSGEPPVKCAFWTRTGLGAFVAAESLRIVSQPGEIPLESVPQMARDWWEYWKRYWKQLRTDHPLPEDQNCALSFPAFPLDEPLKWRSVCILMNGH